MTSIKITGGPSTVGRPNEDQVDREAKTQASKSANAEAVKFERDSTSLHKLYSAVEAEVEEISGDKVSEFRKRIANGDYEPDLRIVAERILAELEANEVVE